MPKAFNSLSLGEDERLTVLAEECAEVIQVIAKIQRHGYDSHHPDDGMGPNNRHLLEKELGHIRCAVQLMVLNDDIKPSHILEHEQVKRHSIQQWLHHNKTTFKKDT